MMSYEEIAELVFDYISVWYDAPAEDYFYQWAWEQIEDELATDNPAEARVYAATLVYIYVELCYYVCDENYCEDAWYQMDEFTDSDVAVPLGFLCGAAGLDCPEDMGEAMRLLVRENHERVVEALGRCDTTTLLTAFHASYAKPKRMVVDEDGDETEADMIEDFESFCRYVDDDDYRAQDVGGMSVSRYEAASLWWENGAEMLDVPTDGDEE